MTDTLAALDDSVSQNYWFGVAALFVLVLIAYWPSMGGQFLWDDDYYVTHNSALNHPDGIEQIWAGIRSPQIYPVPQYYPMTITSFWAQTRAHNFDQPLAPGPFHLINVLLHVASAWMLWTILRRLKIPGAFVAAAIWALHPVQVESVAWITERKNVLSGFFAFASLLIYLRFCGLDVPAEGEQRTPMSLPTEQWKLYALALVLFICSILSKSVTGSLPAVILLLIWWKRGTIKAADVLELIPFFVLAIGMGIVTHIFEKNVVGAQGPEWDSISAGQRFLIAGGAVWFYLWKLFWPANLVFVYPRWDLHSPILVGALIAGIAGLVALFAARGRIGKGPAVVAMIFAGSLFPALGFINVFPMRYSFVADHFQYLACCAVIVGVVWCLHRFFTSAMRFAVASGLILGALTAITWGQNHIYASPANLWTDTVNKNPNAWIAHNNLGVVYLNEDKLDDAERQFNRALELKPDHVEALMNLGLIADKRGDVNKAIEFMRNAIRASENDPIHQKEYAQVYFQIGQLFQEQHDPVAAFAAYRTGIDANHRDLPLLNAMGALLMDRGDLEHAKAWFQRAIDIDPLFLLAHTNMGTVWDRQGDQEKAMREWTLVLMHNPKDVVALNSLGALFASNGQYDTAMSFFKKALQFQPDFTPAQQNLVLVVRKKQAAASQPATTRTTTMQATPTQPTTVP
ncbi:MAG TPA: tetratricopeptide repeat protein [Tepidisphaeraceae bacterium]|jgi:tetratricopeptide (TPR) repeat protein|nr:tetratricopeptide repeat protein [Tepidisphaeraceae bacterium]